MAEVVSVAAVTDFTTGRRQEAGTAKTEKGRVDAARRTLRAKTRSRTARASARARQKGGGIYPGANGGLTPFLFVEQRGRMPPGNHVSRRTCHTIFMSAKKCDSAASPKRKNSKKAVSPEKPVSSQKPGGDTKKPRKPRSRRGAPPIAERPQNHPGESSAAKVKQGKYFLAREGVAFGPYTDFQLP